MRPTLFHQNIHQMDRGYSVWNQRTRQALVELRTSLIEDHAVQLIVSLFHQRKCAHQCKVNETGHL